MKKTFLFVVVFLSGCAAPKTETQASRAILNCIYKAKYEGHWTPTQRARLVEECGR